MELLPIGDSFAREVRGVALWDVPDEATCEALRDAFSDGESRLMKHMLIDLPAQRHIQPNAG